MSVNGDSVVSRPYSHVVQLIKRTPRELNVVVVPQEEDALQMVRPLPNLNSVGTMYVKLLSIFCLFLVRLW